MTADLIKVHIFINQRHCCNRQNFHNFILTKSAVKHISKIFPLFPGQALYLLKSQTFEKSLENNDLQYISVIGNEISYKFLLLNCKQFTEYEKNSKNSLKNFD